MIPRADLPGASAHADGVKTAQWLASADASRPLLGEAAKMVSEGQYEEALEIYQKLEGSVAAYGEGGCLYKLGRCEEAREALGRCLAVEPTNDQARRLLVLVSTAIKDSSNTAQSPLVADVAAHTTFSAGVSRSWFSSVTLIGANLVPLGGVIFLEWDAFTVLVLFWLENLIIGGESILRMAFAQRMAPSWHRLGRGLDSSEWNDPRAAKFRALFAGERAPALPVMKVLLIPFFVLHYGIFTAVHGTFVFALFGEGHLNAAVFPTSILLAFLGLAMSHSVSFFSDYLRKGEYRVAGVVTEMQRPYGRVVVMHLTVIGGAFLMRSAGELQWAVALLVLLKTVIDLSTHIYVRRSVLEAKRTAAAPQ